MSDVTVETNETTEIDPNQMMVCPRGLLQECWNYISSTGTYQQTQFLCKALETIPQPLDEGGAEVPVNVN